jgi:hypothetical protein
VKTLHTETKTALANKWLWVACNVISSVWWGEATVLREVPHKAYLAETLVGKKAFVPSQSSVEKKAVLWMVQCTSLATII